MSKKRLYILLLVLSLSGYAWLAWNMAGSGSESGTPTVCMFKTVTHLPCPSCGVTRALMALMHGEVLESMFINPLGVVLALALMMVPVWIAVDVLAGNDSLLRWYRSTERLLAGNRLVMVPAIVAILGNWVWNIVKGL